MLLPNIALNIILLSQDCLVYNILPLTYDNDIPKYYHCITIYYHYRTTTKKYIINVIFKKNDFHIIGNSYSTGSHHSSFWVLCSKNNLYKLLVLVLINIVLLLNYLCAYTCTYMLQIITHLYISETTTITMFAFINPLHICLLKKVHIDTVIVKIYEIFNNILLSTNDLYQ